MENNHPTARFLLCLLLITTLVPGLSGCSGLRSDFQEKKTFRLTASPEQASAGDEETGKRLFVKQFGITPEFETESFIYRTSQNRFGSDYYHNYMVPPARMITDIVTESLYASSWFSPVSPNTLTEVQYQLWGKIIDLYGDLRDTQHPTAVIAMRLVLEKNTGNVFEPILHKTYKAQIPLAAPAPDVFIQGMNKGLTNILNDVFTDLKKAGGLDNHPITLDKKGNTQ